MFGGTDPFMDEVLNEYFLFWVDFTVHGFFVWWH